MYEYCTCSDRLYLISQLVHLIIIIKTLQHVVVNLLPKIFQLALNIELMEYFWAVANYDIKENFVMVLTN